MSTDRPVTMATSAPVSPGLPPVGLDLDDVPEPPAETRADSARIAAHAQDADGGAGYASEADGRVGAVWQPPVRRPGTSRRPSRSAEVQGE
jgi:hypothetical protein